MDQIPLVEEWKEAGELFLKEFSSSYPIAAAFWVKEPDDGSWYLYVSSDKIDQTTMNAAYTEVLRSAKQMNEYFDPLRVKLVPIDAPIVKAVQDIQARYPGRIGTVYNRPQLGDKMIEGAYIYPSSVVHTS